MKCRRGGTGRRTGLKILRSKIRTGSIPVAGIYLIAVVMQLRLNYFYVSVAQLDRALGYGPRCREFESSHSRFLDYYISELSEMFFYGLTTIKSTCYAGVSPVSFSFK